MTKQTINRAPRQARIALIGVFCLAGFGGLKAQTEANKDGFQAASNKGVGYVFKEHSDGSWQGDHLARIQMFGGMLMLSNFAGDVGINSFGGNKTFYVGANGGETNQVNWGLMTLRNADKNSLTIQTLDNAKSTGIAFQNSGGAYSWSVFRENRGGNLSDLVFSSGNNTDLDALTEHFRITNDGNVGVGVSAPAEKLDVNGNITLSGRIVVTDANENTTVGDNAGESITDGFANSNFGNGAGFRITTGRWNSNFGSGAGQSNTTGYWNSNFGYGAGGLTNATSANSNFGYQAGVVLDGVGNTSLGAKAGVRGHSGPVSHSVFVGYQAGSDFNRVTFENGNPLNAGKSVFVLNNQAQLHNPLLFGTFVDNSNHDDPESRTVEGSMAQLAINTHHLVDNCALTVAGAVHVGPKELDPSNFPVDSLYAGYLLWVERGIVTEDLAIAQADEWADHVFEKDYTLVSLDQIEQHIRDHGHLPNIPSEAEVRKSGYSLQSMTVRFLEKIEELTLHAIAQEKEIRRLKEEQSSQIQALAEKISALEAFINK